jgi:hypothetical protein
VDKGFTSPEKHYVNIKINESQTIFVQLFQKVRLSSNNVVEVRLYLITSSPKAMK